MKIAIGNDHRGYRHKVALQQALAAAGHEVLEYDDATVDDADSDSPNIDDAHRAAVEGYGDITDDDVFEPAQGRVATHGKAAKPQLH